MNEGGGIETLLKSIVTIYPGIWCIVADDESDDGTQEIVKRFHNSYERVSLLDRSKVDVKGLSASVSDGIFGCKTPYFIVMDGDNQHPPEYIINCMQDLGFGADISIGTRTPFGKKWIFSRIIVSTVASLLAKIRLLINGVTVSDPMSGFFGGRTSFVKNILRSNPQHIEQRGYKILFDILKLIPKRTKISGFYFPFGLREYDISKFNLRVSYYFLLSLFK